MVLTFKNADDLHAGIEIVSKILDFTVSDIMPDVMVTAEKADDASVLNVFRNGDKATIVYGEKVSFFRGLMLLCKNHENDFEIKEKKHFRTNGPMFDMSRNSVFKPDTVKEIMKYMALMGLNMFMLYTEDTYEVEGYEYFGHMRGRYTHSEIKEMESFGEIFGIELVPCIQLLAHLATALRWECFSKMRDTHDILMPESEATFEFIDSIFKSISKMYKSRKIHIGMDEARFLGQGRYLVNNGYEEQSMLFCRHLNKCREIAVKYGFEPMMWSDMFFAMAGEFGYNTQCEFTEEVKKVVPRDVSQVYWDYGCKDETIYLKMIDLHREISDNIVFAGGIWTWSGPCPEYTQTIESTKAALSACIKAEVSDVIATVWHNGAECPLVLSLLGLMQFAETDYTGEFNLDSIKENFEFICGVKADDILDMDIAEHPAGDNRGDVKNPARYFLYNDPIAGLLDKHAEGLNLSEFYGKVLENYKNRGPKEGLFYEAFEFYRAVISVLELKADFGLKIKEAYDNKDMNKLKQLYDLSIEIECRVKNLKNVHRKSWLYYNKANGFEIFDMIYGALESRFQTLRFQLDELFADENYVIDELKEERLPFVSIPEESETPAIYIGPRFTRLYSANVAATVSNDTFLG